MPSPLHEHTLARATTRSMKATAPTRAPRALALDDEQVRRGETALIASECARQAPASRNRGERREQEPLHKVGWPSETDLAAARSNQRAEQRRRTPLGVGTPLGAAPPENEDPLFEAQRRLHAGADQHLVHHRIVPPRDSAAIGARPSTSLRTSRNPPGAREPAAGGDGPHAGSIRTRTPSRVPIGKSHNHAATIAVACARLTGTPPQAITAFLERCPVRVAY